MTAPYEESNMRNFILAIAVCALGMSLVMSGCGKDDQDGDKITVCLLPKQKGLPYFKSCADGAIKAAEELGNVKVIYDGPTTGNAEEAAKMIQRWALKGVDVIAVSPNDPKVLASAMKKARSLGVRVITWDADAAPDTRDFFVNQATEQEIGYALVDTMVKNLGGDSVEGDVAIITATLTAANQNAWIVHMKERLKKYPKLKLVAVEPGKEDQKLAFQITKDLMNNYPNLKGIFAISSVLLPGAAEAVRKTGMASKVQVTGLCMPSSMKEYVNDGTVKSVICWKTEDLGALTIRVAEALVSGKLKAGDTSFDAGDLGTKKIKGDNILLGDIMVFTKDNINDYDF